MKHEPGCIPGAKFVIPRLLTLLFLVIAGVAPLVRAGDDTAEARVSPSPSEILWKKDTQSDLYQKIQEGIAAYYNFDFEKANKIFDEIIREYPKDPLGYYMKLETKWWMLINQIDNTESNEEFVRILEKSIDVARAQVQQNRKNAGARFFLGVTYGRWGMYEGILGKKWSALKKSIKGRDYLLEVEKMDPTITDIYTPLGIYDFYTATQSQFIRLLGAFFYRLYGSKKNGLAKLQTAMEKGTYTRDEAKFYTALFYLQFEGRYDEGLKLLQELHTRFPDNLTFTGMLAFAHQRLNQYDEAIRLYDEVLKKAQERNIYGKESLATAHYFAGETLRKAGRLDEAVEHYKIVLDTPLTKSYWLEAYANLELGRICDLKGDRSNALQYYQKVMSLKSYRRSQKLAEQYLKEPFQKDG
jgi:tetratricopeptide (TPR) repeat protein